MAGNGKSNGRTKRTKTSLENVAEYRHNEAKRKNNPPAKIAAEGIVPILPKINYDYSPRLDPVLRFDPAGAPDKLPTLLSEARRRALTAEETKLLADNLRNQEPWLEWAGKREKKSFEVDPVALHIHERVSPQAILRVAARQDVEPSLFADPQQQYHEAVQFYRHEIPWTNRLILGDSLQAMTSLSRREDLSGKVQMIYMDPPYGISFRSNFQSEINKTLVADQERDLTRELEMVKAYRDTWQLGIHSYLSYLRDRLIVARDLLADSGSLFVQISDENVHVVRELLDEIFGRTNFIVLFTFTKKGSQSGDFVPPINEYVIWYTREKGAALDKFRPVYRYRDPGDAEGFPYCELSTGEIVSISDAQERGLKPAEFRLFSSNALFSQKPGPNEPVQLRGKLYPSGGNSWKYAVSRVPMLDEVDRLLFSDNRVRFKRYASDFPAVALSNLWDDLAGTPDKRYVVQTNPKVIERCLLMTTDPGDLVVDPTCGSGTTAFVAEQWGRRWITIDTSRVSIAIARQRLLTSKFEFYALRDEKVGVAGNFRYEKVPHVQPRSIVQNTNLDPILNKHRTALDKALLDCNSSLKLISEQVRATLQAKLLRKQKAGGRKAITDADRRRWELPLPGNSWEHWQVPFDSDPDWPQEMAQAISAYRKLWRAKMDEVNGSIVANADQEELIDRPETAKGVVRVSGPFTVEAVQPPEMSLGAAEALSGGEFGGAPGEMDTFEIREVETLTEKEAQNVEAYLDQMLRLLKMDGVKFPNNKELRFHRLELVLDGSVVHAEGRWSNGETDRDPDGKANIGVVFGPQYGPVTAMQVEESVRQANRRGYDHLVVAGFSFDGAAQAVIAEAQHPKLKVHAAHIRPDVNPGMAGLLKEQPGSQLFSVFGQPRTKLTGPDKSGEYAVAMEGVDIYNPVENTITPTKADKVAAWFLDGDYDGRTFCITQAFFPDSSAWEKLSKALDGVVDPERFEALSGTTSLSFPRGKHNCVAVKVIDPRGNEVMTVHKLDGKHG